MSADDMGETQPQHPEIHIEAPLHLGPEIELVYNELCKLLDQPNFKKLVLDDLVYHANQVGTQSHELMGVNALNHIAILINQITGLLGGTGPSVEGFDLVNGYYAYAKQVQGGKESVELLTQFLDAQMAQSRSQFGLFCQRAAVYLLAFAALMKNPSISDMEAYSSHLKELTQPNEDNQQPGS